MVSGSTLTRLILLRGLAREARHWGDLPDRLTSNLDGAQVVALDLPGNGVRHCERSPISIEPMVTTSRDTLRAAGHEPPYVLVGLSMGAMVAMAWASSHAGEVAGAVLINSSSKLSPWHRRLRWRQIPAMLRIAATRDPVARERQVLRLTSRHPPQPEAKLLASWAAWHRERPVSGFNSIRQLLAAARFCGPDTSMPLPVLVLASENDALVDPGCSLAIASACGAELCIHPTAGHDLPLDDAGWVAEQIRAWWLSPRPGA
jgi:pimeloyl-ACP methyl ester carboxylesterase